MDPSVTPRPAAIHGSLNYRDVLSAEGWSILRMDSSHLTAVLRDRDKETWADLYYDGGYGSGTGYGNTGGYGGGYGGSTGGYGGYSATPTTGTTTGGTTGTTH